MPNDWIPTLTVPCYAAIFASQRTSHAATEYEQTAAAMTKLVAEQPGYLGMESVRDADGKGITISYWKSRQAMADWQSQAAHLVAQAQGRDQFYEAYGLRVGRIERDVRFDAISSQRVAQTSPTALQSFTDLAESRKSWIHDTLRTWCRQATRQDLLLAEHEWVDIAGKADPVKTLWAWAWSRCPALVHDDMGIDESSEVEVEDRTGRTHRGYPDARQSRQGLLVLYGRDDSGHWRHCEPLSIDDVISVHKLDTI
ncbi:hypothetical protein GC163_12705 [bacterium]|nr:hypothetical protein [bacterium]